MDMLEQCAQSYKYIHVYRCNAVAPAGTAEWENICHINTNIQRQLAIQC